MFWIDKMSGNLMLTRSRVNEGEAYYSNAGDSGCIVYSEPNSSNQAYLIGIHMGHSGIIDSE